MQACLLVHSHSMLYQAGSYQGSCLLTHWCVRMTHPASACRKEAAKDAAQEPILSSFLYASVLSHETFEMALAAILANRLSDPAMMATELIDIFHRCSNSVHWTVSCLCMMLWLSTIYLSV